MEYRLSQRGMGCEGTGYVANDVVREGWCGSSWGKEGSLMIPGVHQGNSGSVSDRGLRNGLVENEVVGCGGLTHHLLAQNIGIK